MRTLTWIDADGAETVLDPTGEVFAAPGVAIAGMPPIRSSVLTVPLQPGGRWQQVDHGPRDVSIPIALSTSTLAELEDAMDTLVRALDPTRGDGRLRVTRHDATARELTCRYIDSLTITEATAEVPAWTSALILRAVDPYWYDTSDTSLAVAPGEAPGFFPFFPLRLGASETVVATTVTNSGQAATWPVITINGPADSVVASNLTTGQSFTLEYTVDAGETVTIDTRPGVKTVTTSTDPDVSLFGYLTDDSEMWALAVGSNALEITMTGSDETSLVDVRWRRRWLSA